MCGIVGYIGNRKAWPLLIEGLRRLEYRGYDSAGIAIYGDDVSVLKEKGRIDNLNQHVENVNPQGSVGIGHTRWATHGVPDNSNAHPHQSMNGTVTLIHNGIVENYLPLKNELLEKGYVFRSETDSEVIAQLFEDLYTGDPIETIYKVVKRLEGSYSLGILVKGFPDRIFAVRKDSPLIVGKGEGENFLASDIPALLPYTRDCYIVQDGEVLEISKDAIRLFGENGKEKAIAIETVNTTLEEAEKEGYDFFMAKEIFEQPRAVLNTVKPLIKDGDVIFPFAFPENFIKTLSRIYIVACGTAYHVGLTAKYILEDMTRVPVAVDIASEFRYRNPIIGEGDLCIFLSQSGETADTLASLREAKKRGAFTMSIVNVRFSSIANESDGVVYTNAGIEIAVASTKAFSAQLSVCYLLSAYIAKEKGLYSPEEVKAFTREIRELPAQIQKALESDTKARELSKLLAQKEHLFYIGRGVDFPIVLEGALKIKEISYIHTEGYGAGELKHGTISLVEPGTVILALATDKELLMKMISNIKEVKSRSAKIIAVVSEGTEGVEEFADEVITLPEVSRYLTPSVSVIPLQLLAYYTAVERGLDVDKPRNLAKSVTVE